MSKIAKKPVILKDNVTVDMANNEIKVSGPKGSLFFKIPQGVKVELNEGKITVKQVGDLKENLKAMLGLTRATIANLVTGVSDGFETKLELSGVGYRAQSNGDSLNLSLGFSHPVTIKAQPGISFSVVENVITVMGIDKVLVGNTASKIRSIRPPEPYKGKGIKYVGERIRRKAGKAAKAVVGMGAK